MKSFPYLAAGIIATLASGCFGTQNQAQVKSAVENRAQPVVEGFIEYAGPNERWAGPQTFLLHVVAREESLPRIEVLPEAFGDWARATRELASKDGVQPAAKPVSKPALTAAEARERLNGLSLSLEEPAPEFHGCTTPVRVRLVRGDGGVVEKQGCRAATGWPRSAGETVQWAMNAATSDAYRAAYVAAYPGAPRKPAAVLVPAGH